VRAEADWLPRDGWHVPRPASYSFERLRLPRVKRLDWRSEPALVALWSAPVTFGLLGPGSAAS
jgi:hypothetical protein